jgi:hypothetical protein
MIFVLQPGSIQHAPGGLPESGRFIASAFKP